VNVYYNEHDRFAAAWLRELIADGLIPAGDVDERDIQLVQPADLAGYDQCHFFAGIGGWAYAIELAGWDGPVWTGSCPCQPFSSAGKGAGFEDTRHLWPAWFRLIRECRPPVVFGEQVASADGLAWFDHVSADLEAEAYAVGAADLAAASIGAPHRRQRLFFVADADDGRWSRFYGRGQKRTSEHCCHGVALGDTGIQGLPQRKRIGRVQRAALGTHAGQATERGGNSSGVGQADTNWAGQRSGSGGVRDERDDPWRGSEVVWLPCTDGRLRPTQPGIFPLVDGFPNRVGALRGAGNAIVPQVTAEFIRAFLEV